MNRFPFREDGPQKRTWSPCIPACGLGTMNGRAYKFSVKTENGVIHRFLLDRAGACWLAASFVSALFPRAGRFLSWLIQRLANTGVQSPRSSDKPKRDGSPHGGQAV